MGNEHGPGGGLAHKDHQLRIENHRIAAGKGLDKHIGKGGLAPHQWR